MVELLLRAQAAAPQLQVPGLCGSLQGLHTQLQQQPVLASIA